MTGGGSGWTVSRILMVAGFACGFPVLWLGYCAWSVLLVMDLVDPCGPVMLAPADVAARAGPVALAALAWMAIAVVVRFATGSWRAGIVPILAPAIVLLPELLLDGGDCSGGPIGAWREAMSVALLTILVLTALGVWIAGILRLARR